MVPSQAEISAGLISQRSHSKWLVHVNTTHIHAQAQLSGSLNFYRTWTPTKPCSDRIKSSSQVTNSPKIGLKYIVVISSDVDYSLEWLHTLERLWWIQCHALGKGENIEKYNLFHCNTMFFIYDQYYCISHQNLQFKSHTCKICQQFLKKPHQMR